MNFFKSSALSIVLMGAAQVALAGACGPDTLSIRGSFNNWATTPMACDNGVFKVEQTLTASDKFKFDVSGNWQENYGDNTNDGSLDASGSNISAPAAGDYEITVNYFNKTYTLEESVNETGIDSVSLNTISRGGCYGCDEIQGTIVLNVENHPNTAVLDVALTWWDSGVQQPIQTLATTRVSFDGYQETYSFSGLRAAWHEWETISVTMSYNGETYSEVVDMSLPCESTMFMRGSFNAWAAQEMTCNVSGTQWSTTVDLAAGARFKFDRFADWSANFGDTNADGTAEASGANIVVNEAGTYRVLLNASSKQYSIIPLDVTEPDDVTLTFKRQIVENGQLTTVNFGEGYQVFFDDAHPSCGGCGGSAGTTEANSTFSTTDLTDGEHTVLLYKAGSTSTTIISQTATFTVAGNGAIEIVFEPVNVTIYTMYQSNLGEALYITGQTDYLGNWSTALKMTYVAARNRWEYIGSMPQNAQFKLIKADWVAADSIATSNSSVVWQQGSNNQVSQNVLLNTFRNQSVSPTF